MMKKFFRTLRALLCAALLLLPLVSCLALGKNKPSGTYIEEGTEYPFSCTFEGNTLVWLFCGEEEYRTTYVLRYEKNKDLCPGLFRVVTPDMPFPDPCDNMLFWDRDNDLFVYSFFSTDGVTHESRLLPGREG